MKVCFVDETTELDGLDDLTRRGRGGMVTSLRILPDVLCQLGHECYVMSDIKNGGVTDAGTVWYQKGTMSNSEKAQQYDILVYNRQTCNGFSEIKAKKRVLWTHDIPHNGFIPDPRILNAIDMVVFMSDYAERVWRKFFPGIRKSCFIPNGVAKDLFYPRKKDRNFLIYCSAPNRGLHRLPLIFESIRTRHYVKMAAYSNMSVLHPQDKEDYSSVYKRVVKSGVKLCDPVPQTKLSEEIGRAGMMILPTEYPEICSNSVLQALASGTPVLTTGHLGSTHEWIWNGYNGYLTDFQTHDYWVFELELVRFALFLLDNPKEHEKLIKNAPRTRNLFTWEQIGKKWHRMLNRLI